MIKHHAICLKKNSYGSSRITVYERERGKVDLYLSNKNMLVHYGTTLAYHRTQQGHCSAFEVISLPSQVTPDDLNFIHHLLELYYYFTAYHAACPDLFELLHYALTHYDITRELVLFRFFVMIGNYPEKLPFQKSYFLHLLSGSLPTILREKLDPEQCKMLGLWVQDCINMHAHKKYFKTHYKIARYL